MSYIKQYLKINQVKMILASVFIFVNIFLFLPGKVWAENIIVLYTNDIHCKFEDVEGFAQLAQYKKDMQKETPYVALVDAGDAIQGGPIGKLSQGESIINVMNSVGYDFAVLGNHEFDYGMKRLFELSDKVNCGYYSGNFIDKKTGKNIFPEYKIMPFGKTKVAFIAVTTPESLTSSTPAFFQDDKGNFIYSFCEDKNGTKLYKKVQETVLKAKNEGADYVILVAHLGLNGVTPYWSSKAVAENTEGIDAIIDGHSHEKIVSYIAKNKEGKNVIITQTGNRFQTIGKLVIDDNGNINTQLISDFKDKDLDIENVISKEEKKFEPILNQTIGKSQVDLISTDKKTGEELVRKQETNLGDFVTDAYKTVLDTDAALCNGGGIRSEIPIGTFSYNDILTSFPFGNMCVILEVTGQQILDALEMGVRNYPDVSGGFLQVSGLSYTVDSSITSNVIVDEKGNFVKVDGEYRVKDVLIDGKKIDLNKKYTIGGTSYILKLGGNGMVMFKDAPILQDEMLSETDVIIEYIQNYLNAVIADDYKDINGQGRIKIIDSKQINNK